MKTTLGSLFVMVSLWGAQVQAGQKFDCEVSNYGKAQIEISKTTAKPDLAVLEIQLQVAPARTSEVDHFEGVLGATLNSGDVMASGRLNPAEGVIGKTLHVNIQGETKSDGRLRLQLFDQERYLQFGYGVFLTCRRI